MLGTPRKLWIYCHSKFLPTLNPPNFFPNYHPLPPCLLHYSIKSFFLLRVLTCVLLIADRQLYANANTQARKRWPRLINNLCETAVNKYLFKMCWGPLRSFQSGWPHHTQSSQIQVYFHWLTLLAVAITINRQSLFGWPIKTEREIERESERRKNTSPH